jgi:hypothetical protein
MKKSTCTLLCGGLLFLAAAAAYGSAAGLDVTVSDGAGKLAYRGKTNADGVFTTGRLAPGNYVVQFNSKDARMKESDYAIVVAAGKQMVTAESVAGEKFTGGGVAMRVKVGSNLHITGQVASGGANALGVKVVNGKRYILVGAETGSNIGPHWVEEGVPAPGNLVRLRPEAVREIQERGNGPMNP